jgi:hypothetical protein
VAISVGILPRSESERQEDGMPESNERAGGSEIFRRRPSTTFPGGI